MPSMRPLYPPAMCDDRARPLPLPAECEGAAIDASAGLNSQALTAALAKGGPVSLTGDGVYQVNAAPAFTSPADLEFGVGSTLRIAGTDHYPAPALVVTLKAGHNPFAVARALNPRGRYRLRIPTGVYPMPDLVGDDLAHVQLESIDGFTTHTALSLFATSGSAGAYQLTFTVPASLKTRIDALAAKHPGYWGVIGITSAGGATNGNAYQGAATITAWDSANSRLTVPWNVDAAVGVPSGGTGWNVFYWDTVFIPPAGGISHSKIVATRVAFAHARITAWNSTLGLTGHAHTGSDRCAIAEGCDLIDNAILEIDGGYLGGSTGIALVASYNSTIHMDTARIGNSPGTVLWCVDDSYASVYQVRVGSAAVGLKAENGGTIGIGGAGMTIFNCGTGAQALKAGRIIVGAGTVTFTACTVNTAPLPNAMAADGSIYSQ